MEIYNCGSKPIALKKIYFRLRFYTSTDSQAKQKWSLRKSLQYGEWRKFQALEYLVRNRVLHIIEDKKDSEELLNQDEITRARQEKLNERQSGLGALSNISNLFTLKNQEGILFYQREKEGTAQSSSEVYRKSV